MEDIQYNISKIPFSVNDPNYNSYVKLRNWRVKNDRIWDKSLPKCIKHKGMIFLGCSFTWGQGLYYYSNLDSLREPPPDTYDFQIVSMPHLKFMESVRFPRQVANYFNSFEIVHPNNGGSNDSAIDFCRNKVFKSSEDYIKPPEYGDFSYLIFQMTQWQRKKFFVSHKGKNIEIHNYSWREDKNKENELNDYLIENNMTLDDLEAMGIELNIKEVKKFLMEIEDNGIKTIVFSWPEYYIEHIKNDEWLSKRYLNFKYNDNVYNSIEKLIIANPEMRINSDIGSFKIPPKDHHPSLKCHDIIAKNIIERIKK